MKDRHFSYSLQVRQSDLLLRQRDFYIDETRITVAYRQLIREMAMALGNDTSMIDQDAEDFFQFEKAISKVINIFVHCPYMIEFLFACCTQFHWTDDEQRARHNETVRTTVGNLLSIFNTTVSFCFYFFFYCVFFSLTLLIIFVVRTSLVM